MKHVTQPGKKPQTGNVRVEPHTLGVYHNSMNFETTSYTELWDSCMIYSWNAYAASQ